MFPTNSAKSVTFPNLSYVGNPIHGLPVDIGLLSKLECLELQRNSPTTLPHEIGALTNLRELNLGYTQLTSVPLEIGQLSKLSHPMISGDIRSTHWIWAVTPGESRLRPSRLRQL